MMVMRVHDASSVEAFAPIGHDDVDLARFHQTLQLAVHRCESDLATLFEDQTVQVLGADEATNSPQSLDYLASLSSVSR